MRLIAHTCSNTEIICALGRADWLVGVDNHSDFPPEIVENTEKIGPDLDIDIDRVLALKPDLVITSLTVPGHERCLARLQQAGLPCLVTEPHSLSDVATDIRRIGAAIDATNRAEELAEQFDALQNRPPPDHAPVPVLVEWWPKPVIVPGGKSWVNDMLAIAGGCNPWAGRDAESLEVDADMALKAAPQAIIMSWCGVREEKYHPHVVRRRPGWQNIPALKHDQIHPISEAWLGRPGPRLLQGIRKLQKIIAPLTPDP
jgi:iron complex transport system substrate-binding protein